MFVLIDLFNFVDLPTSVDINRNMEISSDELDQQNTTYENWLTGYFSLDTVFNLSKKLLSDAEIKVLENGLD